MSEGKLVREKAGDKLTNCGILETTTATTTTGKERILSLKHPFEGMKARDGSHKARCQDSAHR